MFLSGRVKDQHTHTQTYSTSEGPDEMINTNSRVRGERLDHLGSQIHDDDDDDDGGGEGWSAVLFLPQSQKNSTGTEWP